jgi:hypothetical protein
LLVIILGPSFALGQAYKNIVISQPDAPVEITSYEALYQPSSSYSRTREGIEHHVSYKNKTPRKIIAIEFGLVSFDIWNEFLDNMGGITMKLLGPGAEATSEWTSSRYGGFAFHTGVTYVSKVRFDDGEIWKADLGAVIKEMKKIEADFDASRLKKKEDPKS